MAIPFAFQKLRVDANAFEVVAYLDDSPRWANIPDPDGELPHMGFVHTTGIVVKVPLADLDPLDRAALLSAIVKIAGEEVLHDPKATARDRAEAVLFLAGLTTCDSATASTLRDALSFIRALTHLEPTQAERDKARRSGYPSMLSCYDCKAGEIVEPGILRPVIGLGRLVNVPADPTQSYKLACGHTTF